MNQHLLFLIALVVVLLVILGALSAFLGTRRPSDYPYEAYDSLLSPAERSFFGVLQQALPTQFMPLAKIRLADLLRVQRVSPPSASEEKGMGHEGIFGTRRMRQANRWPDERLTSANFT